MFDIQEFEDSGRQNGIRYWLAHDFMEVLGYKSWTSFSAVIRKAMASCLQLDIVAEDAFIPDQLEDGTRTYRLTRFACYLVAMQADAKKPEVAQAQVSLAAIAEALIEEKIADSSLARIEEREKLKHAEKQLSGAAQASGVASGEQGIFKDAGFRGMYNMSLKELKVHKGLPGKKTLYDFMGLTELAANTFRVTQTSERLKRNRAQGLKQASDTAWEVGREVREVMARTGDHPEDLQLEGPISDVRKHIRGANRKMVKLDSPAKKKTKKKSAKKKTSGKSG